MNLKKIMAAVAIASAFGFTALEPGPGVASADPLSPNTARIPWSQDGGDGWWGPGHGHGHWGRGWGHGWGGPGYGYGPGWYGPGISACISATGPWGYVTGSACI